MRPASGCAKPCQDGIGTANFLIVTATILLVDDDAEVLKALTKVLEKDGH